MQYVSPRTGEAEARGRSLGLSLHARAVLRCRHTPHVHTFRPPGCNASCFGDQAIHNQRVLTTAPACSNGYPFSDIPIERPEAVSTMLGRSDLACDLQHHSGRPRYLWGGNENTSDVSATTYDVQNRTVQLNGAERGRGQTPRP